MKKNAEVDKDEISKFESMATEWWDPNGKFKPLAYAQSLSSRIYCRSN